jgi:hypothetical protein
MTVEGMVGGRIPMFGRALGVMRVASPLAGTGNPIWTRVDTPAAGRHHLCGSPEKTCQPACLCGDVGTRGDFCGSLPWVRY